MKWKWILFFLCVWFLGIVTLNINFAQSSLTMSEAKQIAKIRNMEAKFRCLAANSHPVYEHVHAINVPTSHLEWVTDYYGAPLPEGTVGTDQNYLIVTLTTRKNSSPIEGWLVDNGCFLLPPPPP